MRYLFFAIFLSSCGTGRLPHLVSSSLPIFVDDEAIPFLERFDQYANAARIKPNYTNLAIYRTDALPEGNHLAICRSNKEDVREIIIYNQFWDYATDVGKEIVMFHELGHCTLHQTHRPASIMQTYKMIDEIYLSYYDDLIKELFSITTDTITFTYRPYKH